jgi:hypothetical protein
MFSGRELSGRDGRARSRVAGAARRWRVAVLAAAVLGAGTVVTPSVGSLAVAGGPAEVAIEVLSTRADLVSGGDALVEVVLPRAVDRRTVRVLLDDTDITDVFAVRPDGRFTGLVTGLRDGPNVLTARTPGAGAELTVVSHPRSGPVFSGPHIQPWTCAPGAVDANCNRAATFAFRYKSSNPARTGFHPYDPQRPAPDVATTTTDHGVTVPYIVRVETGVLNRDQYAIAVLYDPAKPWRPWEPQPQFNRKLVVTHGSSCDTGYAEGTAPQVLVDTALRRGFAVMSHALDHNGHNCNIVTQAESLIMTKEHLAENYGEIRYTIGTGCSGGAVTQYQVANAYPGVYQGITPACSFPDSWTSRMLYEDYSLLRRYFENPARWQPGVVWTPEDIASVWGHPNPLNPAVYNTVIAPVIDPSRRCPGVPDADVYDPATNPDGVRCSLQDYMVNVFGKRPQDGFAGKPWDNVGVQFGLKGLMAGKLTPEQFLDVNVKVGSRDIDYTPQDKRAEGDGPALAAGYRSGAFNQANNLDKVAIIDLRGQDPGVFHDAYRSYAVRARLVREHGDYDNHVLWRGFVPLFGDVSFADTAILAMDEWLAQVERDRSDLPIADKIVKNKPAKLVDQCAEGGGLGIEPSDEVCSAVVDVYSTARIEAGMPFTDDVVKCQLTPLRRSDYYPVRFTEPQWQALQGVFPTGVCDYALPGVGQQDTLFWPSFAAGPGGEALGAAPRSRPLPRGRQ